MITGPQGAWCLFRLQWLQRVAASGTKVSGKAAFKVLGRDQVQSWFNQQVVSCPLIPAYKQQIPGMLLAWAGPSGAILAGLMKAWLVSWSPLRPMLGRKNPTKWWMLALP